MIMMMMMILMMLMVMMMMMMMYTCLVPPPLGHHGNIEAQQEGQVLGGHLHLVADDDVGDDDVADDKVHLCVPGLNQVVEFGLCLLTG